MGPINDSNNITFKKEVEQFETWWNNSNVSQAYPENKNLAFIAWMSGLKANGLSKTSQDESND